MRTDPEIGPHPRWAGRLRLPSQEHRSGRVLPEQPVFRGPVSRHEVIMLTPVRRARRWRYFGTLSPSKTWRCWTWDSRPCWRTSTTTGRSFCGATRPSGRAQHLVRVRARVVERTLHHRGPGCFHFPLCIQMNLPEDIRSFPTERNPYARKELWKSQEDLEKQNQMLDENWHPKDSKYNPY